MGKQLPLFQDSTILPTGKYHISYSEINDHTECSFRHKLKYVDKIEIDSNSIHTFYGKALHNALETFVYSKKMPEVKAVIKDLQQMIVEIEDDEKRLKIQQEAVDFIPNIAPILEQFPVWMDENFPGWKPVSVEHYLFESIEKQTNIHFKGFVDLIIQVPKKRGKGMEYVIIDHKTCSWGWPADRKRDFKKQMQIILYKYYFCKFMNIDIKEAKCGFLLLKRVPRKDGNRIEYVPISAGPKTIDKALKQLNRTINQIKKGLTTKNRMACEPFCVYKSSRHCP